MKIPFIIQEYIPGEPTQHIFLDGFRDRNNSFLGLLARRRLRMYPPNFGNSTYMESIELTEVESAVDQLEKLFTATGFSGIFSAEFKFDRRDSLHKILEVNIRPWWYNEFAALCGMNAALISYRSSIGMPLTSARSISGKRCLHPYYDFFARSSESPGGVGHWLAWIFQIWGSSNPWLCWDDPLPGLFELSTSLRESICRRIFGSKR